jgi:hypothetical protein
MYSLLQEPDRIFENQRGYWLRLIPGRGRIEIQFSLTRIRRSANGNRSPEDPQDRDTEIGEE